MKEKRRGEEEVNFVCDRISEEEEEEEEEEGERERERKEIGGRKLD